MANVFASLLLPAFNGVGTSVSVSTMGALKTIVAAGSFPGVILTIEASADGLTFAPLVSFQNGDAQKQVTVTAQLMRVRVTGRKQVVPFSAAVSVAAQTPQDDLLTGTFADFDPRIDGLAASPSAVWAATDAPISFRHYGPGDTQWTLEQTGEQALAACTTAAQVNALYQGLARRPDLDFTPLHLGQPDMALQQVTDLIGGDDLTLQGLATGAQVDRSPLFDNLSDAGYQASENGGVGGTQRYFAATDNTKYVITTQPFTVAFLWSSTRDAAGGIIMGKYADPGTAGRGWGISSNSLGGFGFLFNGSLGDLNTDTPFGAPRVDDGQVRVFHAGRSLVGPGLGYVRTANIAPVSQVGLVGDLSTNVPTPFGLLTDTGALRFSQGDQQFQEMVWWEGQAAENVTAHVAAIESGLQSQLPAAQQPGLVAVLLRSPKPVTPARALSDGLGGASFQPNNDRAATCSYGVKYTPVGASEAYVELRSDASNPPLTPRDRAGGGAAIVYGGVSYTVPAGHYVELVQVDVVAGGTCTLTTQVEEGL